MISRRAAILSIVAVGGILADPLSTLAQTKRADLLQGLDTDKDSTVDLDEAKKAASALFDRLDVNHDGTIDRHEVGGRLSAKEFAAADVDKEGTLTKDEYLAVVEQRFNAADTDHDGTLTSKELRTKAGRALLRLLK
jgi:Ca2+-binding EF-hand superfamily protein